MEKIAENHRNGYVAQNHIVSKLSHNLIAQVEDLNKGCVKVPRLYML